MTTSRASLPKCAISIRTPRLTAGPTGFLWYDFQLKKILPNLAASYEISADGKVSYPNGAS